VDSPGVWPFPADARGECCIISNEDQVLVGEFIAHPVPLRRLSYGVEWDLKSSQAIYSSSTEE
jgi:hypothetical protein